MINVTFLKKKNNIVSFEAKGHADFDEYNKDIVCSAVSAISQTTLIGILDVLHIKVDYSIKEGLLSLSLKHNTYEEIEKCQVLLNTMLRGLKNMERGYEKYIKVSVEEV